VIKYFDKHSLKSAVCDYLKKMAFLGSVQEGFSPFNYIFKCTAFHLPTGAKVTFTRDIGMHSSGWFKNPDYERCFHLSLSFLDPNTMALLSHDKKIAREWCQVFFFRNCNLLWIEPPYSPDGKQYDVWHYRLFCDENWQPIKPRKEVYSKDFTPAGWKSWSDVQAEKQLEFSR
jgi:hypothetical protein